MKNYSSSVLMGMLFINFWDFGTDISDRFNIFEIINNIKM